MSNFEIDPTIVRDAAIHLSERQGKNWWGLDEAQEYKAMEDAERFLKPLVARAVSAELDKLVDDLVREENPNVIWRAMARRSGELKGA